MTMLPNNPHMTPPPDRKRKKGDERSKKVRLASTAPTSSPGPAPTPDPPRLIRFRELRTMIPLSRTSIWRHVAAGAFPKPLRLSKNAVAWRRDEVETWVNERDRV